MDSSSEEGLKPDDVNGMIEFKNVTFRYPSREEVPVISACAFCCKICNIFCGIIQMPSLVEL